MQNVGQGVKLIDDPQHFHIDSWISNGNINMNKRHIHHIETRR